MSKRRKKAALEVALLVSCLSIAHEAHAGPIDLPNTNARVVAMGGTGAGHIDTSVAMVLNPAGIGHVKKFQTEATINNLVITLQAPANGPNTKVKSMTYGPMFFLGGTYRPHKWVAVGLYGHTPAGGGASYKDVNYNIPNLPGRDFGGTLMMMEFGPTVALVLPFNLRIGVGYRISYAMQGFEGYQIVPNPAPPPDTLAMTNDMKLSGWGYTGVRVGVQYQPIKPLHIGVVYRSPVKMKLKGSNEIGFFGVPGTQKLDVKSTMTYTDRLTVGVSYEILPDMLLASVDYNAIFYGRYKSTRMSVEGQTEDTVMREKMRHSHLLAAGFEFMVIPSLALRLGFEFASNHNNEDYHNSMSTGSPGHNYTVAAGVGYRVWRQLKLDLTYACIINNGDVTEQTDYNLVGEYKAVIHFILFSGSFAL